MIRFETRTNENEDNTLDEDYVMNASKSSNFESRHDDATALSTHKMWGKAS